MNRPPCSIKMLNEDQWIAAAATAGRINPANAPDTRALQLAAPGLDLDRSHLALLSTKYWGSARGVHLTVGFLDGAPADLRARIVAHMNSWGQWSNVQFVETATDPQVRITRAADGYWSYLGTDVLQIPADQATMNLQDFSMNTSESEFHRVVRHETGHTLGFPHEHMRDEIVNRIDQAKAIAYFGRTQGWSPAMVTAQVLTPLDNSALQATQHADPFSIMCYWLPAEIMKDSVAIDGGTDIDPSDQQFAAQVYPKPNPFPNWLELDDNPATVAIVAAGPHLYQLHNSGRIWVYTGTPHTGWLELDDNPATEQIVADGDTLYQRHNTGRIWVYTGTPHTGWTELDDNPATVQITADAGQLYQRHNNGNTWVYTGTPHTGWLQLDGNPATVDIDASGGHLFQRHNSGRIWVYTG